MTKDKTFQMRTTQKTLDKMGEYKDAFGLRSKAEVVEMLLDMVETLAKNLHDKE